MEDLFPLLVTAAILLLPLIPACIIYKLLTPRRDGQVADHAQGKYEGKLLKFGQVSVEFNVFGSSATYVVLLAAAFYIHYHQQQEQARAAALKGAWLVEVPVRLKDDQGQPISANNGEMQAVQVELEPSLTEASANTLQFWVLPNNGRFPTARFSIPDRGLNSVPLDLNNKQKVSIDLDSRRITGVEPVWIGLGQSYAVGPQPLDIGE